MRMLGKKQVRSQAWPFSGDPQLIALRIGASDWVMDHREAVDLAQALVEAVDRSRAMLCVAGAAQ